MSNLIASSSAAGIVACMTRPVRLEFPGAVYHVMARGNRRNPIYHDEADRRAWLSILAHVCKRHRCVIHAFCQMGNHYHLLIETAEPNLSLCMQHLNGRYARYFNWRHDLVGHVFQGRYQAILVQKGSYLLELSRYIVLNPLRAKMVASLDDWPWSSFRYYVRDVRPPRWLGRDWVLSKFGATDVHAIARYAEFVMAGMGAASPLAATRHQILLGDDAFIAEYQHLERSEQLVEAVKAERGAVALSLCEYQATYANRDEAMARAYLSSAYTMLQIASAFGISTKTVSRAVAAFEKIRADR